MKIVVSGAIGSGKSTAVRAAMAQLGWREPGGFFTHWGGAERGAPMLFIETWTGEVHPMARRSSEPVGPGSLPYELDLARFNPVAIGSLALSSRPVVIDELGVIELGAKEFVAALAKMFRSPRPVLAVIQERALDRWMSLLGPETVSHPFWVEPATRDALPAQMASVWQGSGKIVGPPMG